MIVDEREIADGLHAGGNHGYGCSDEHLVRRRQDNGIAVVAGVIEWITFRYGKFADIVTPEGIPPDIIAYNRQCRGEVNLP
jgi:hypothetical protein